MHQLAYHHQRGDEIRTLRYIQALCRHPRSHLRQLVERPLDFIDVQLTDRLRRVAKYAWQGRQHRIGAFQHLQRIQAQGRNPWHQGIFGAGDGLFHCLLRRREMPQSSLQQRGQ